MTGGVLSATLARGIRYVRIHSQEGAIIPSADAPIVRCRAALPRGRPRPRRARWRHLARCTSGCRSGWSSAADAIDGSPGRPIGGSFCDDRCAPRVPLGACSGALVTEPRAVLSQRVSPRLPETSAEIKGTTMKVVVIGGTGLIGSRLVTNLRAQGHAAVAASLNSGVNTVTGEGLAEVLEGASVVVDVSNSPSFDEAAATKFFETSTRNLLSHEAAARGPTRQADRRRHESPFPGEPFRAVRGEPISRRRATRQNDPCRRDQRRSAGVCEGIAALSAGLRGEKGDE